MVDALKRLDKKILILVFFIILMPIVLIIFLALIRGCSNETKMTYSGYEKNMLKAAEKYFKGKEPVEEGDYVTVNLDALVGQKYIKSADKALKDTCSGSVTVRRNGSSIASNNGGFLNYTVSLNCKKYNTVHLADKIKENIVTSESGLYKVDDEYVFRGDLVNNRIQFFGKLYRIISMDKDGILRLVESNQIERSSIWDDKYNKEADDYYGKTIYKDSTILKNLISVYEDKQEINKEAKAHIVAYDTCIGKRSKGDYSINKELDCGEKLEKQVISLLSLSDFARASTDPECVLLNSKSCKNYNYLSKVAPYTWTSNSLSENTYSAFYYVGGMPHNKEANLNNSYNYVIYIDGNELYQSGDGSKERPYIIK